MRDLHAPFFHAAPQTGFSHAGVFSRHWDVPLLPAASSASTFCFNSLWYWFCSIWECSCDGCTCQTGQHHVHNMGHVSTHSNITDASLLQTPRKVPGTFPQQLTGCSDTDQRAEGSWHTSVDTIPHITDGRSSQPLWRKPPSAAHHTGTPLSLRLVACGRKQPTRAKPREKQKYSHNNGIFKTRFRQSCLIGCRTQKTRCSSQIIVVLTATDDGWLTLAQTMGNARPQCWQQHGDQKKSDARG